MDNFIEDFEDLVVTNYRIDKYNIYHVYFLCVTSGERFRYFLGGNSFEKWCYDKHKIVVIDVDKKGTLKILNDFKRELKFTLDIDSLYPK